MATEHGIRSGVGELGERSAGPAAWTARKFCGIAYDTLRLPYPRLVACLLALPLAHFYSLRTEKSGQKRV